MKKLIPLILIFVLVMFTGCSAKGTETTAPSAATMPEIIDLLCEGVDVPNYEATELDEETFEYFTFIPRADGLSGYQADALINSIPHSLVIVRTENGDAADIAQKMLENANVRKWICVNAEVKQSAYTEHYVLLVMSSEEAVESIIANFKTAVNDGDATTLDAVVSEE